MQELQEEIKLLLENNQNFLIKNTTHKNDVQFIIELLREINREYLLIDLESLKSIDALIQKIADFIQAKSGNSLAPFDFEKNEPFVHFIEVIEGLEKLGSTLGQNPIVIFNQFQNLGQFNYEDIDYYEILRGDIQHHQFVTYIFLGDEVMLKIFNDRKSPFLNFCRKLNLNNK